MKRVLSLVFLLWGFLWAEQGYIIVQETKGKEAHISMESKSVVYLTKSAMRIDTESVMKMDTGNIPEEMKKQMPREIKRKTSTIQRISKGKVEIYSIDHQKGTYIDFSSTPEFIIIGFMSAFIKCDRQTGECHINKNAFKPTNEFKNINGYKARKIIIKTQGMHPGMDNIEMATWFTKDNKNLVNAERLRTDLMIKSAESTEFGKNNSKLIKELKVFLNNNIKKYGAPIKWEMPSGEVTIISVKSEDIKSSVFEVPKNYKKVLPPF